jgi:hypothetical protein
MAKDKKEAKETVKKEMIKVHLVVAKLDGTKATLKLVETDEPHGILTMGNHGIEIALDKLPEKFNSDEHILKGKLIITLDIEDKQPLKVDEDEE